MSDNGLKKEENELLDEELDQVAGGTSDTSGLERPKPPAAPGTGSGF